MMSKENQRFLVQPVHSTRNAVRTLHTVSSSKIGGTHTPSSLVPLYLELGELWGLFQLKPSICEFEGVSLHLGENEPDEPKNTRTLYSGGSHCGA